MTIRERLADWISGGALARLQSDNDRLRGFIADFAREGFDALPMPHVRHPADEQDPVTDAMTVWAWQDDARAVLK